jgi:hypothetical protein
MAYQHPAPPPYGLPPQQPPVPYGPQYGYATAYPHPRPPDPPELPDGASPWPKWPWWYGIVAGLSGFVVAFFGAGVVAVVVALFGGDTDGGAFNQIATVVFDVCLVAAAVFFASRTVRPRLWHFGLRRTKFWSTLGWAALGMASFWVFAIAYSAAVRPKGEQETLDTLGVDKSTIALIGAAMLVIMVAPLAEELFFRAFFYRALRSRLPIWGAALIDGCLFGAIHYENPDTLPILPILGMLGVIFCLVYERTGNIFATIGLHAFNNTLAFGGGTDHWATAGIVGGTALVLCMTVPRLLPAGAPALRPARA